MIIPRESYSRWLDEFREKKVIKVLTGLQFNGDSPHLIQRGLSPFNFIAEMTAVQKPEETPGWELVRDRTYGKTRLCMWRRN